MGRIVQHSAPVPFWSPCSPSAPTSKWLPVTRLTPPGNFIAV